MFLRYTIKIVQYIFGFFTCKKVKVEYKTLKTARLTKSTFRLQKQISTQTILKKKKRIKTKHHFSTQKTVKEICKVVIFCYRYFTLATYFIDKKGKRSQFSQI